MIKAVIFDAEGVVIDTHKLWVKGDLEFLANHCPGVANLDKIYASDIVAKIVGNSIFDGAVTMQKILNFSGDAKDFEEERIQIMEKLFKKDITFVNGFTDFFNNEVKGIFKTAVGTAIKKEFMELVEQKLPIRDFFGNNIFHIHDVGNISKPSPDIFLYAARQLGVSPAECLIIEDAPNGIEAARRAGMKSVGITTSFAGEILKDADIIVDSFDQINLGQF